VTLGAVPAAGIAVTHQDQIILPLACPTTPAGCDASGVLTIHLPKTLTAQATSAFRTDAAAGADATVLASFSGRQIASGHSALIAVHLRAGVLRRLQTLKIRRVRVTLHISNHLTGGPAVNTVDTVYLLVPPLPATACPVPTGQVTATTLGPVTLGATRGHERRTLPRYTARNYHTDNYCLYDGSGIRVGYASPKLLGSTTSITHAAIMGRIVLALTANPCYTIDDIRHGTPLASAARHLHLAPAIHTGRNHWYIIPGTTSNLVLKVRHGVINEIGIATKSLTSTRSAQRALLISF
jgi:hypothetical protein